jgi:hypothetical protein
MTTIVKIKIKPASTKLNKAQQSTSSAPKLVVRDLVVRDRASVHPTPSNRLTLTLVSTRAQSINENRRSDGEFEDVSDCNACSNRSNNLGAFVAHGAGAPRHCGRAVASGRTQPGTCARARHTGEL